MPEGGAATVIVLVSVPPDVAFSVFATETDLPARHRRAGREFSRMVGMWWSELMTSLREQALHAKR